MDYRTRYRRNAEDDEPAFADQSFRGIRQGVRDDPFQGDRRREQRGMGRELERGHDRHAPFPQQAPWRSGSGAGDPHVGRYDFLPDHERGTPDRGRSLQGSYGEADRYFGFDPHHEERSPLREATTRFLNSAKRTFRGPKGYKRSDERILEDVSDRLAQQSEIDPSDIEVSVSAGEVTLRGFVAERWEKFRAEEIADGVSGVTDVHNQLRLRPSSAALDIASAGETSPASPESANRSRMPRA